MRAGENVQITQMTQNPMDGVTISVPSVTTVKSTAEQAQSKANDAANAAQRAQSTANSAVEQADNNRNKIASMDNALTACREGKYLRAGAGVEFISQNNPMDGITISTKSQIYTLTVTADEFKENIANIPISDSIVGTHRVRTISLKPKSQNEVKLYAEASPIFLDSDDDPSIKGDLRIIVKKATDLKFTVFEQEVKQ